jgi:hypothetical protein
VLKVAVTDVAASTVTEQDADVPVHPPLHPANCAPLSADANRVTIVLGGK